MGFLRRNGDALILEAIGALLLGGVVAVAVFLLDQAREDQRFENAQTLSQQQFERAQQLANEQYARDASATISGVYSFGAIDLRNTTLSGLILTNCPDVDPADGEVCTNLIRANLSNANLITANLRGANISMANLSHARVSTAVIRHALGASVNFHCAIGVATLFGGSDLQYSDFTDSSWNLSQFTDANLSGSDFSGANITSSDFSGANLSNVDFEGAWYLQGLPPAGLPDEILEQLTERTEAMDSCS